MVLTGLEGLGKPRIGIFVVVFYEIETENHFMGPAVVSIECRHRIVERISGTYETVDLQMYNSFHRVVGTVGAANHDTVIDDCRQVEVAIHRQLEGAIARIANHKLGFELERLAAIDDVAA